MVLPLLFSFLGGGLAKAGVLGAAGSFLANPLVASAIGSGIGTLAETGDPKKALLGGLGSFAGGSLMGKLMGGVAPGATSTNAISGPMTESVRPLARPEGLGQAVASAAPGARGIFDAGMEFGSSAQGIGSMMGGALPGMLMPPKAPRGEAPPDISKFQPMQRDVQMPGQGFRPGVSGEFDYGVSAPYTTDYMSQYAPQKRAMGGLIEQRGGMGQMNPTQNPYAQQYADQRAEMMMPMGGQQQAMMPPQMPMQQMMPAQPPMGMAGGGQVMQRNDPFYGPVMMQEGGIANIGAMPQELPVQMPNEREMISEAVAAIKGQHPQPEVPLAAFLAQYGEEAFRDLVDRVQSGEMDDTAERSEGQLNGPGDGMDDLIPATIDGQQDVLLSDGEYIIPADVVSHLGNGSTDAGARALDQMAERVREARTGQTQQAPQVPQDRMMPA
jgi:hypothetical protein